MSPDLGALDADWVALLDELESAATPPPASGGAGAVDDAGPVAPWSPPTDLGPLPGELAERAGAVLARAREAAERLGAERRDVLGQLGALRAVGGTAAPERPVYLDASA